MAVARELNAAKIFKIRWVAKKMMVVGQSMEVVLVSECIEAKEKLLALGVEQVAVAMWQEAELVISAEIAPTMSFNVTRRDFLIYVAWPTSVSTFLYS